MKHFLIATAIALAIVLVAMVTTTYAHAGTIYTDRAPYTAPTYNHDGAPEGSPWRSRRSEVPHLMMIQA